MIVRRKVRSSVVDDSKTRNTAACNPIIFMDQVLSSAVTLIFGDVFNLILYWKSN